MCVTTALTFRRSIVEMREQLLLVNNDVDQGTEALDSDLDDMPDGWEWEHFGNLDATGSADADSDGLINRMEYQYGTDPGDADSDSDGVSDGDEVGTTGTDPSSSDSDGDGVSDCGRDDRQVSSN